MGQREEKTRTIDARIVSTTEAGASTRTGRQTDDMSTAVQVVDSIDDGDAVVSPEVGDHAQHLLLYSCVAKSQCRCPLTKCLAWMIIPYNLLTGESIRGMMWSGATQTVDLGSWTASVWVTLGAMVMLGAADMASFMAQATVATRRSLRISIVKLYLVNVPIGGMDVLCGW